MNKIVTIDNGNSRVKAACFRGDKVVATEAFVGDNALAALDSRLGEWQPQGAIVCSSADEESHQAMVSLLRAHCDNVVSLTDTTPLPIRLNYRTPHTLGRDRIATAAYAGLLATTATPPRDILVVDAGTAVTYDLVTAEGEFMGGNIAPGISLRLRALHQYTGRLPLVAPEGDAPLLGYDTTTAIRSGVLQGVAGETRNYVARLTKDGIAPRVLLTGGDAELLAPYLSDLPQVEVMPLLLAQGLNYIYHYNNQSIKTSK